MSIKQGEKILRPVPFKWPFFLGGGGGGGVLHGLWDLISLICVEAQES